MKKALRFLLLNGRFYVLTLPCFLLILIAGIALFGTDGIVGDFFSMYLTIFPMFCAIVLLILSMSFATTDLNTGLSLSCRRKDLFRAELVMIGLYTLVAWLCQFAADRYLAVFGQALVRSGPEFPLPPSRNPNLILSLLLLQLVGVLLGVLYLSHPRKSIGLSLCTFGAVILGTLVLMLSLSIPPMSGLWGDLHWLIPLILLVLLAVVGAALRRVLSRASVR